ncbi:MAG: methylated-DNA--[protein]-cysteine S-methyltransferase [Candidatus Melainabacteria bacterium]
MPSTLTSSQLSTTVMTSPVGLLQLCATEKGLCGIDFLSVRPGRALPEAGPTNASDILSETGAALKRYFAGERETFEQLPLDFSPAEPTDFQLKIWQTLCQIPFGGVVSYGQLARLAGNPGAARAVGGANGRNPIPIVVPCHRVIGANGQLTGYMRQAEGGIAIKHTLLRLEGVHLH